MSGGNDSEGFSDIERKRIWKLVMEKEKEEKRDNIVIKGLYVEERINNECVQMFIKGNLGIAIKVKRCRVSRNVIVTTMENSEMKRKVMKSKSRLKGKRIFIEHDLSWHERKIQEKINKWVKDEKDKGRD